MPLPPCKPSALGRRERLVGTGDVDLFRLSSLGWFHSLLSEFQESSKQQQHESAAASLKHSLKCFSQGASWSQVTSLSVHLSSSLRAASYSFSESAHGCFSAGKNHTPCTRQFPADKDHKPLMRLLLTVDKLKPIPASHTWNYNKNVFI